MRTRAEYQTEPRARPVESDLIAETVLGKQWANLVEHLAFCNNGMPEDVLLLYSE